jgi:hypothetical protein
MATALNKKVVALLVALLGLQFATPSFSQELDSYGPIQSTNLAEGRFWQTLSPACKTIWLRAYLEGVSVTAVREAIKPSAVDASGKSKPAPFTVYDTLIPKNMTWEEARIAIDGFYSDGENLPIPISNALELVAMKARGDSNQKIQQILTMQRRAAKTPASQ